MEFTAAATKRLNQYAFLPSKKTKKYVDVHSLYLKAAHSYLSQAQQAANATTSSAPQPTSASVTATSASASSSASPSAAASSFYTSAAESFTAAAELSSRKLQLLSSTVSSHLEAAMCYQQAEEWEAAYEALKRAMDARELCIQQRRVSPQASPASARLPVPPLAGSSKEDRRRGRRRSDAGPIRDDKRASKSMPASPVLTAKNSPTISVTAPGSPQPEDRARRSGMLSRMKKLMVRTDKDKDKHAKDSGKAALTNGDAAAADTAASAVSVISPVDVSPLPPLILPTQASPPSPQLTSATAPSSPYLVQSPPIDSHHLLPPLAASTSSPPSPSLDILPASLQLGQLPAQSRLLLDPQFSLLTALFAASLGFELWEDMSRKSALDCFEVAFRLLSVLDEPAHCLHCPAALMRQSHATLQLLHSQVAGFYLTYHDNAVDGKQPWECDLRLLQRARELLIIAAKARCEQQQLQQPSSNGVNGARHIDTTDSEGQADGLHSTAEQRESLAATGLPLPVQKVILSHSSPSLDSTLFSACLCDAIITAYTHSFHQRVLFTPPLLHSSLLLSPSFFDTLECRFLRQLYGLLQLSSSAPARFIPSDPHPPASSPEEQYRRLLLSLWGNDILNEFVTLLTRFLYEKRGMEAPKPLSPMSAARERGEEGKVHPLVAMAGLVKDETDSWVVSAGGGGGGGGGAGVDGVDGAGVQLLMKVKRIIKHNVAVPGFVYTVRTAATAV